MLRIIIKDGHLLKDGKEVTLAQCHLSNKVKEVFSYLLHNNVNLQFEKIDTKVSFSAIRPDLKRRLLNALMADRLTRHHGLNTV